MGKNSPYDKALSDHIIGDFVPVVLDALEGAGVEASAQVWANGTTQITLKGDRSQIATVLGCWYDGLAQMHAWDDEGGD